MPKQKNIPLKYESLIPSLERQMQKYFKLHLTIINLIVNKSWHHVLDPFGAIMRIAPNPQSNVVDTADSSDLTPQQVSEL
jgi:hypothetical protein